MREFLCASPLAILQKSFFRRRVWDSPDISGIFDYLKYRGHLHSPDNLFFTARRRWERSLLAPPRQAQRHCALKPFGFSSSTTGKHVFSRPLSCSNPSLSLLAHRIPWDSLATERAGFEPAVRLRGHLHSKQAPSSTQPPLQFCIFLHGISYTDKIKTIPLK